jgi:hypothetical protein
MPITGRTLWAFSGSYFVREVTDEYAPRFDGKQNYTKDLVLGATTSAQSYVDIGAFEVAPLTMKIEFETEAARNTFQALIGTSGTLSNTRGRSYTALLVEVKRIDTYTRWLAEATWEAR